MHNGPEYIEHMNRLEEGSHLVNNFHVCAGLLGFFFGRINIAFSVQLNSGGCCCFFCGCFTSSLQHEVGPSASVSVSISTRIHLNYEVFTMTIPGPKARLKFRFGCDSEM